MSLDWQSAYDQKLKELPSAASFKEVMDCVWVDGILAHISPADPKAYRTREEGKRPVWVRGNPVLYWRILYAAHGAAGAYREHWPFRDSIVTWPVALAGMIRQNLNTEWRGEDGMLKGIDAVARRAEAKLRELGETPHRIPFYAKGTYTARGRRGHGDECFHVVVKGYDTYGYVVLDLADDSHYTGNERLAAWRRLGEIACFGRVEPSDLNPADFTTKFGEPLR